MKTLSEIIDRAQKYPQNLPSLTVDSGELTRHFPQYRDAALHKPESTPDDISAVVEKVHSTGKIVKVILETCRLTRLEKIIAHLLAQTSQADFGKTSTGFSQADATMEDVNLMRRLAVSTTKIKTSAAIHSLDTALALIHTGADCLWTSKAALISADAATWKGVSHG